MLTRRRYQRRYSIQKLAGTQLQFYVYVVKEDHTVEPRPVTPGIRLD